MATGARPAVPPITGLREALAAGAAGTGPRRVFTLQTLDDALVLKTAVDALLAARKGGAASGSAARRAAARAQWSELRSLA